MHWVLPPDKLISCDCSMHYYDNKKQTQVLNDFDF